MLVYIIPILVSFLPMFDYVLWFCFAMVFIASVPQFIRRLIDFV